MLILRAILKFLIFLFAVMLIIFGVIAAVTPIPFGLIFIAIGFFLLTAVSPSLMGRIRRRWPWLDRRLKMLDAKLPRWLARHLRKSDAAKET